MTAALALMEEPIVTKAQASRGKQTLRALPGQFTKLARNSLSILRTTPLAAKLIVSSAVVSVPSYLTKMFLQQRLVELGKFVFQLDSFSTSVQETVSEFTSFLSIRLSICIAAF